MLWGYFDESGEHDATGKLMRLTVAGCVAPLEAWQQFEQEWQAVLKRNGLATFHMVEHASRKHGLKSPYKGTTLKQRNAILKDLVSVMERRIHFFVGAKIRHDQTETKSKNTYAAGIVKMITQACLASRLYRNEDVALVFAAHPEVAEEAMWRYGRQIQIAIPNLNSMTVKKSADCAQLQAADLFAYEFSHCNNWNEINNLSQSLRTLRSGEASFFVDQNFH